MWGLDNICSFCERRQDDWHTLLRHYDECEVLAENRWQMYPWEYYCITEKEYHGETV